MPNHIISRRSKVFLRKGRRIRRLRPNQMVIKNKPITMDSPIIMSNRFNDDMEEKLRLHTECHIKGGNSKDDAVRHEMVMRELMKRGSTFDASHFVAQKQVPMKNQCA